MIILEQLRKMYNQTNFNDYYYYLLELLMKEHSYNHANSVFDTESGHSLWIGDIQAAENVAWIKQKNIKTVITAASGFKMKYDSSIKHIIYDVLDFKSESIGQYFDIAAYQIKKWLQFGSVLVHCGAGVSRSPTLVIAFLIRYHNMTFKEALKHCKARRPQICPNLGFELQLKEYENKKQAITKKSSFDLHSFSNREKVLPHLSHVQFQKGLMARTGINMRPLHILKNNNNRSSILPERNNSIADRSRQLQWLKKIAQFRFGATNMRKWRINGQPVEISQMLTKP